jgi:uncharacterized membrane protein
VAGLTTFLGGPEGRHAGRHPWWSPVRVLLLLVAVTFAAGMVQKSGCYASTWEDTETRYVQMCYSDLPYLYVGRGFAEAAWPYSDDEETRGRYQVMEYPVGISYWAWGTAHVTHLLSGSPDIEERAALPVDQLWQVPGVREEIRLYVAVNAVGFALLALLSVWLLARVDPRRPWDASALALSPALALTALINWDFLAVALVAGALWAWARDRPVVTGVLVGLGTAAKLYPLFLLGAVLVVCVRERRWRDLVLAFAAAALAWLVVDLPAMLSGWAEWKVFWTFNSERGPDLGSIWLVLAQAGDLVIGASTVNQWSWAFFVAWCLGVAVLGLKAPQSPTMAQLGFLVVAGFLLVNKVYSPQYVLWLLPLAVLARPRWRDQLVWQGGEILYFCCVWWYLGGRLAAGAGDDQPFYWVAILVRIAVELYLVVLVARDMLRPGLPDGTDVTGRPGGPQASSTRSNAVAV